MAVLDYSGLSYFKGKYDEQVKGILNDIVADEYSSSATYAVGDYVLHDGKLYICKTAIATAEPWTVAHWKKVNISSEIEYLNKKAKSGVIYGFHINQNESDPDLAVTYLEDAVGMTPAYMDFTNDVFNYGSWENAFFMPRPCMLKYDGTVDYYLDPNDYTKKENGEASDVADSSYGGNAMMEWGRDGQKIWYKVIPDLGEGGASIYISNEQQDEYYHAWSFINQYGDMVDHFYTAIYNGKYVGYNAIRSLSGTKLTANLGGNVARTYCKNNNVELNIWDMEVYSDVILINFLLTLMCKSLASQEKIGQGLTQGTETDKNNFVTGTQNDKGLFYGTNDDTASVYTNAVKVFGMENWWGYSWRRMLGFATINSNEIRYKLAYGTSDGSSIADYEYDSSNESPIYDGYIVGPSVFPSGEYVYINKYKYNIDGSCFPCAASGASAATYYCDCSISGSTRRLAAHGGSFDRGSAGGAWSLYAKLSDTSSGAFVSTALSCKPVAQS